MRSESDQATGCELDRRRGRRRTRDGFQAKAHPGRGPVRRGEVAIVRVIQITDTHLSRTKPHFAQNWPTLAAWVRSRRPALVIHTGDVTVDGAGQEDDMVVCAAALGEFGAPALCVPGNHDVGEARHAFQPVNTERIARWRRHFGPDHWFHDIEGWRLVGLDSLLFGSGEPEEERQFDWLEAAMRSAGDRRLAWFMHQPLFVDEPEEGDAGYWAIGPEPRARLLDLARRRVALVASGHVHRALDRSLGGARYIWAPSAGFVCGPVLQPEMVGELRLGAVLYEFAPDGFEASIEDIAGLRPFVIDDVVHEVYPPRQAA
jgi:3',5'-cyclic AMP phosphodiesterase CpdA